MRTVHLLVSLAIGSLLMFVLPPSTLNESLAAASAQNQPEYAKFGRIAVQTAIQQQQAEVIDYLYQGKFPASATVTEYRFRLWMRKDGREYGLIAHVFVNNSTGQQQRIELEVLR
ncbi:conserved hypothetical protein [Paenibacillus curdlanolyticus YK9]|uniref:DUF3889 domain-containing protein n=1 Tax=Paenibacillus curdlanolyticus YK9 TaxID=717606 RepID=E0I4E1_9BACL|nr:DUF3889 domain-containing protein [Paenibacillus curdlanolyticus]EFM13155.1 conserved hypothetical protein [Paenibacillus curdlanolyticus YK9]